MSLRQQRGAPWRGQLPFRKLATAPPVTWTITGNSTSVVTLTLDSITGTLSLSGVPAVTTDQMGLALTGAALTLPNTLSLTFDAPVDPGTVLTVPPFDPALRTNLGSYLAPGSQPTAPAVLAQAVFVTSPTITPAGDQTTVYDNSADAGTISLRGSPEPEMNFIVGCTAASLFNCHVTDVASAPITDVLAGTMIRFTWDGAAWQFAPA